MENAMIEIEEFNVIIYILKMYFLSNFTYYIALKSINSNVTKKYGFIIIEIAIISISVICGAVRCLSTSLNTIICLILLLSIIFSKFLKKDIGDSILIITISLSINYIFYLLLVH